MASRILLADDSITIQKVVNLTFADEGIEVVAVSNGDVAERRLAEVTPDLVLADIFMPGKNGYELCEAIKENPQFRNVPVVLLVGAFEPFDQAEARRVRADAHLTKPFESRTLVETVRRLISASWRTTTGPIAPMHADDDEREEGLDALAPGAAPPPFASPLPGKLELSAMMVENDVPAFAPNVRNTGALGSPAPDATQDTGDLGFGDAPSLDAVSTTLTDTSERFESLEFSPDAGVSQADMASPFGLDAPMFQDFETSTPTEPAASPNAVSFHPEASDAPDTIASGAARTEDRFDRNALETTKLDRPMSDGGWQASGKSAPLSYQSPDFSLQTDTTFGASESSGETACATLLAVDEPLGDVLFDESHPVETLNFVDAPLGDSLSLEFIETEVAARPAASKQFDLVETVADATVDEPSGFEPMVAGAEPFAAEETPSGDDQMESPWPSPVPEPFAAKETSSRDDQMESPGPSPVPDPQPVSYDAGGDSDWTTPHPAVYSTAQLDSVIMPSEAAESFAEHVVEETRQPENTEEASFSTQAMWPEEEARFTPIDIEAVPAEEALAIETSEVETGFAFAPAPAEEPAPSIENPVPSGANGHADEALTGLSPSAMDEIVRRVVAELSESVVREVAWEVVPDCVERVIDQLTRESLSKRA